MPTIENRITLPLGDPALYLLTNPPTPCHRRFGPSWAKDGTVAVLIHAISPASGGECRGYWQIDGVLWTRPTSGLPDWPELDQAVADALRMTVRQRYADPDLDRPHRWLERTIATPAAGQLRLGGVA